MLTIRPETAADLDSIRYVNKQAFGGDKEAVLVDRLRQRGVLPVSLVADRDGEIVGHIAFSPVSVEGEETSFEATTLAPLAVLPSCQKQGIGRLLIEAGIERCLELGLDIIFLVGHPEYYPRFGFVKAGPRGIGCEFEAPEEAFMLLELRDGALAGRKGIVKFQPEFRDAVNAGD